MVAPDYGSTDLKDLEATKPHKKEKRPPTSSLIVVLLQGVMQVGGFTAIIPTATMYVKAVGGSASTAGWLVGITALGTGLMQPFLGYPLKHYRLKTLKVPALLLRAICRRATPSPFGWSRSTRPRSYTSCCSGTASPFPRRTIPPSRRMCPRECI